MNRLILVGSAAAALGLVACSGGGGGGSAVPTPGPTCGPVGIQSQLIYPAPGATQVPDAQPQIVIAVSSPLPINTDNLVLFNVNNSNNAAGTQNPLAQIQASQLPAGSASTTIANPTYEAVNLAASLAVNFASGTTIQTAINTPSSTCTPQNVPGSFTIQ
jgi:hypothetical protein